MLYPRIIPCLLVHEKGLVKTVQFKNGKYVGDPINAVKIFNEKEVDELMVLDIDATIKHQPPDYSMIAKLANECNMPLCYGGGITTPEQAFRILNLGVEKIALSAAAIARPELATEIAAVIGAQSVVIVLDVKKHGFPFRDYEVFTHNGTVPTKQKPDALIRLFEKIGVGEFVINSIDRDGMMNHYDWELADRLRQVSAAPITFLGGAGSLEDIGELIRRYRIIGCAAGSIFVFKGKYKAVLISYPDRAQKERLIQENLQSTEKI